MAPPLLNVPVSSTAIIVCSPAAGCNYAIQNTGTATAYISNSASVTTTTGVPLTPGSRLTWIQPYNAGVSAIPVPVYAICPAPIAGQPAIGTTLSVQGTAV
jgi:hypothetical protein